MGVRQQQGVQLEELLEQDRQQELRELQKQQQQRSQQLEELLRYRHAVRPSRCRHHHRGLRPGRRVCRSMARRPLRGSVRERPLPSRLSQGGRTAWWRSLA